MAAVSQAEFAARHGVSRKTVTVWKAKGYLTFSGTKVDVAKSDKALKSHRLGKFSSAAGVVTPPEKPVGGNKKRQGGNKQGGNKTGPAKAPPPNDPEPHNPAAADIDFTTVPDDPDAIENMAMAFIKGVLSGRFATHALAEAIKQNALAAKHLLEVRREAGELIEISVAEATFFDQARANRDALINWSQSIAADMAQEFGLETDHVAAVLKRYVLQHLEEIGEPDPTFESED